MKKLAIAIGYYLPQDTYINNDICIPLQLGFDETNIEMGIQKDNMGDNRSNKHPLYSEYSGIYWIWKNVDAEYKGMLHHRRFFSAEKDTLAKRLKRYYGLARNYVENLFRYKPSMDCLNIICESNSIYIDKVNVFLRYSNIIIDEGYKIIAPSPYYYRQMRVRDAFSEVVTRVLQAPLQDAINELYPEYVYYFQTTFNGHTLYYGNMTIMEKDLYDKYCRFVFDIFDYIEKVLVNERFFISPCEERSLYRMFGYMGELLTSTFILKSKKEGIKVKECPVLFNKAARGNEITDYSKIKLSK